MPRSVQRVVQNLAMLVIAVAVAVGAAEVAIRFAGLASPSGIAFVSAASFDRVPGLFEPNQVLTDGRNAALPFAVRINELGYRGASFPRSKPSGEFRILFAGDSFTFGDFVEDADTLPAQLERALSGCTPRVRVVNAGVGGSSIDTERHVIERGLTIEPDLVVLNFYENDLADLAGHFWDELASNRLRRSRPPLSWVYGTLRRSALVSLVLNTRSRWRARLREDAQVPAGVQPLASATAREAYASNFEQVLDLIGRSGVPFVFSTYPSHFAYAAGERSQNLRWVEDEARRRGLTPVSLLDALASSGASTEQLYLLPHDGHPRPRGYTIAAKALSDAVAHLPGTRLQCPTPQNATPGRQETGVPATTR